MTSMIKKLLLKIGVLEEVNVAPLSLEPDRREGDTFVVLSSETLSGGFETDRDVEIRGTVKGHIYTPNGRVLLTAEGTVSGGTICAREVIWEGAMGGNIVHCSHVTIVAGAKSIPEMDASHLYHESMAIGKIGGLDVSFDRQAYLPDRTLDIELQAKSVLDETRRDFLHAG